MFEISYKNIKNYYTEWIFYTKELLSDLGMITMLWLCS